MGLSRSAELSKKFSNSQDTINEVIIEYPDFKIAQNEKAKICMMIGDWEQFNDLCTQMCYEEPDHIFAGKAMTFYHIARLGDMEYGAEKLEGLIQTIQLKEPRNVDLIWKVSQLFARISGRNPVLLDKTMRMM